MKPGGGGGDVKPAYRPSAPKNDYKPPRENHRNNRNDYYQSSPSSSSSSSLSEGVLGYVLVGCLFMAFFVFIGVRKRLRREDEARRTVIYSSQSGSAIPLPDAEHAPSAPPIDAKKFWNENLEWLATDTTCTICLGDLMKNDSSTCIGQSACCKSWFHKDCISMYWSTAGEVKCPNCRHEII